MDFEYEESSKEIFKNISMEINENWKLGVSGRNGTGKTTLLKLISGELLPGSGEITAAVNIISFPPKINEMSQIVKEILRNIHAPFSEWEIRMETLINENSHAAIAEYGEIEEIYRISGGYEIDTAIEREFAEMGLDMELLDRAFDSLSGGEQTKALLASLFLKEGWFPLIDEPTSHLDLGGIDKIAEYLGKKSGFICVSHDRYFLDKICTHILSINKSDIEINKCTYSQWEKNFYENEEYEKNKNERLKKEINSLKKSAARSRSWASKSFTSQYESSETGFVIGNLEMAMMQRAKNIEKRIDKNIEEKQKLLKNYIKNYELKFDIAETKGELILTMAGIEIKYGDKTILENFNMNLYRGERVAITGKNGSGKSSIFKALFGSLAIKKGIIYKPGYIKCNISNQTPEWNEGILEELIEKYGYDRIKFRNILACFGMKGEIIEKNIMEFSEGEKKKIELAKSLAMPASVFFWDEALNYMDIPSRINIENAILKYQPTMVFIEHDRYFVDKIATRVIEL